MRRMILAFLCAVSLYAFASGQTPATSPAPAAISTAGTPSGPTIAYTLPPDKLAKSKALYDLRVKLLIIGTIYSLVQLLGILYFGVMARYRDWAEKASRW